MMPKTDPNCCLCGLPYERIGNNPAPLLLAKGARCCDACNEVVILARMDMKGFVAEYERVLATLVYWLDVGSLELPNEALAHMVKAAICASRGPGLLAIRNEERAQFQARVEAERTKL